MRQRRILQAFSVTVLALAIVCAPMAVASAKSKHHTKPKPNTTPRRRCPRVGSIRGASSA